VRDRNHFLFLLFSQKKKKIRPSIAIRSRRYVLDMIGFDGVVAVSISSYIHLQCAGRTTHGSEVSPQVPT